MKQLKKILLGLTAVCLALGCACSFPGSSNDGDSVLSEMQSGGLTTESGETSQAPATSTDGEESSKEESSDAQSSEEEAHTHILTFIGAEEGDCLKDGNIAYYACDGCGKYFADEAGEEELTAESLVIKGGHTATTWTEAKEAGCATDGNIGYYTCDVCGKYLPDSNSEIVWTEEDVVIKASHTLTYCAETAPQGKTNGRIAHYACDVCDKFFADSNGAKELFEEDLVLLAAMNIPDFLVEVEEGKDPVVLQLSDPQICNWGDLEKWCYSYIRETVEATEPDLIILTGDIVYGRFDPNGSLLQGLIAFMESLQIPWAPVFGNHDNESLKGVDWQCAQLEAAEYCLFKQGDVTGNGNYSVGIAQGDELLRVFYMMDSNGCSKPMCDSNGVQTAPAAGTNIVKTSAGFGQDQIAWYTDEINAIHAADSNVKISFAYHIQQAIFGKAFEKYNEYDNTLQSGSSSALANPLNLDKLPTVADTDFGYVGRIMKGAWDTNYSVFNGMKALGADSIFVGHEHCNNSSIVYEGVRFQYGQKSSKYDRYNTVSEDGTIFGGYVEDHPTGSHELMGGTVIPISSTDGSIDTGYVYYAGNPFYFEPKPVELPVNGLKLDSSMLQSGMGMTIHGTAYDENVNAYKIYSEGQGKIFFDTALAIENSSFTFTVFIPHDSASTGSVEFWLRVKPTNNLEGSNGRYVEYTSSKIPRGEWKTFVVDITSVGEDCTEFSIMLSAGTTIWLRDIAFFNSTVPQPEEVKVNGVELIEPQSGISLTAEAFDDSVNAYKATASAQGKVFIDEALVANKSTITFTVYVSERVEANTTVFMVRIKPNDLTENGSGHIYYTPNMVEVGTWQTFTVDISGFGESCTEFSFIIPIGQTVWFRDITIS